MDLKPRLLWDTQPPFGRIEPVPNSPYFRLDGKEWCLKLRLVKRRAMFKMQTADGFDVIVIPIPRADETNTEKPSSFPKDKKINEKDIMVSCYVLAGNLVLGDIKKYSSLKSGIRILRYHFSSRYLNQNPSVTTVRWKIHCQFSSDKPLSIQMNNETILLSTGPSPTEPIVQSSDEIPPDLQRLADDFSRLLDKEIIPDARLVCCGRTWSVHKSVLTARSEVFAAMFRSGMAESETSEVHVEDLEAPVLDILLKYIYSGKVPDLSDENVSSRGAVAVDGSSLAGGLYGAADRYALHGLREAGSHWMADRLSHDNCLKFLVTADDHSDDRLKEAALSFVAEHYALIEKDAWNDFSKGHPLLAIKVLERFAPTVKQYSPRASSDLFGDLFSEFL